MRRLLLLAADAVVILFLILDGIVTPIFRPLLRWVTGLRFVTRLLDVVALLPPYVILLLFAIPVVIAEPAKLYALWLLSHGMYWAGVAILGLAYVLSLIVAERIYRAGEAKLRTIAWFARLIDWMGDIRDQLLEWAQATQIWVFWLRLKRTARELTAKLLLHLRVG